MSSVSVSRQQQAHHRKSRTNQPPPPPPPPPGRPEKRSSGLPGPLETWEQQRLRTGSSSEVTATTTTRRILPLPGVGGTRKESPDCDSAKNVRMLLARHQHQNPRPNRVKMEPQPDSSDSEHFSSALPGDSFPATDHNLMSTSLDEELEDDLDAIDDPDITEQDLLRRLHQSQARMEQIKRMLVNQRGFIVQALKQMAEGRHDCCENVKEGKRSVVEEFGTMERDRTLGKTVDFAAVRVNAADMLEEEDEEGQENDVDKSKEGSKMCPMCEAAFPADVDAEAFECHVVEHFCFEEAETLKYVPPTESGNS